MRVLVCGSRDWVDLEGENLIALRLAELPDDAVVIHGAARGADMAADKWAVEYGLQVERFYPNWEKHGKRAGILRNVEMLDTSPDLVLAFWDGQSSGTKHTIDEAQKRGIPIEVNAARREQG